MDIIRVRDYPVSETRTYRFVKSRPQGDMGIKLLGETGFIRVDFSIEGHPCYIPPGIVAVEYTPTVNGGVGLLTAKSDGSNFFFDTTKTFEISFNGRILVQALPGVKSLSDLYYYCIPQLFEPVVPQEL